MFEPLRFAILYTTLGHSDDDDIRKSLRFVLGKCYIGDWFVMYQLAKNVNRYFLREFIKGLRDELRETRRRLKKAKASKPEKVNEHQEKLLIP